MKKLILLLIIFGVGPSQASFEGNSRRYMSAHQLIDTMDVLFVAQSNSNCTKLLGENRGVLGDNSPLTGKATSGSPSQGTLQWLSDCASEAITGLRATSLYLYKEQFLTPELKANPKVTETSDITLATMSDATLKDLIKHEVSFLLGSDETIKDFGLIENPDAFRAELLKKIRALDQFTTLSEVVKRLVISLMMRDEFLSY